MLLYTQKLLIATQRRYNYPQFHPILEIGGIKIQ